MIPAETLLPHDFMSVTPDLIRFLDGDAQAALILVRIDYRAQVFGEDGWWKASVETLAEDTGLSYDQVRRTARRLVEEGHVERVRKDAKMSDHTWFYRVVVAPTVAAESPLPIRADVHASEQADVHASSIPVRSTTRRTTPRAARSGASAYTPVFEEFWSAYPRKVDKRNAFKVWNLVMNRDPRNDPMKATLPGDIARAAVRLAEDPNREDRFTPHPATWLRRDGWLEGPLPPRPGRPTGNDIAQGAYALAARLELSHPVQIGAAS